MEKRTRQFFWFGGTLLMGLSKAYDCLLHDLLIVELGAYGLDKSSLNLFNDLLRFRKQKTKLALHIVTWLTFLGVFLSNLF